jgi:hypothetical protein
MSSRQGIRVGGIEFLRPRLLLVVVAFELLSWGSLIDLLPSRSNHCRGIRLAAEFSLGHLHLLICWRWDPCVLTWFATSPYHYLSYIIVKCLHSNLIIARLFYEIRNIRQAL